MSDEVDFIPFVLLLFNKVPMFHISVSCCDSTHILYIFDCGYKNINIVATFCSDCPVGETL